jgi:hypothetical protein
MEQTAPQAGSEARIRRKLHPAQQVGHLQVGPVGIVGEFLFHRLVGQQPVHIPHKSLSVLIPAVTS